MPLNNQSFINHMLINYRLTDNRMINGMLICIELSLGVFCQRSTLIFD